MKNDYFKDPKYANYILHNIMQSFNDEDLKEARLYLENPEHLILVLSNLKSWIEANYNIGSIINLKSEIKVIHEIKTALERLIGKAASYHDFPEGDKSLEKLIRQRRQFTDYDLPHSFVYELLIPISTKECKIRKFKITLEPIKETENNGIEL